MNSAEQERPRIIAEMERPESRCAPLLRAVVADVAARYEVQYSAISVIDGDRHSAVATHGFDPLQTPIDDSICSKVVQRNLPIIINNARFDPHYNSHPAVMHFPHIRFYCGCPLILGPAIRIGALSIFDPQPRPRFTLNDTEFLVETAAKVVAIIRQEAQRPQHQPA